MEQGRKADDVAADLLSRIVAGRIAVGSVLPRESDLATEYGVGRSVVREANKLLEVHRLVRPTRRLGTVVLDPLRSVTPQVLRAMLFPEPGKIDRAMLAELLEIRAVLDAEMARLAATRRTRAELAELERLVDCIAGTEPGTPESTLAIEDFGLALARASHNRLFEMLSHWHRQIAPDLGPALATLRALNAARGGHRILLAAIRARDADTAHELVTAYHTWATEQVLRSFEEETDARAPKRKASR
jgi:GntR family transcriptional regulator, transcriptional repressor for pyruvate dehydrogenase complex